MRTPIGEREKLSSDTVGRKRDLDSCIIRIIAAFAIVLTHMLGNAGETALFLNGVCRFAVPVFVMSSGRYVLAHEPDIRVLTKKALRLLVIMLCWSALFYFYYSWRAVQPSQHFIAYLLAGPSHLWYIWAIITLYLMSPMIYVFCKNASQGTYKYAMCFAFLAGTIVTLMLRSEAFAVLSAIIERTKLPYQLGLVFCFIYGDYFRRYIKKTSFAASLALFVFGGLATGISTRYLPENISLSFFSPTAIASAIGLWGMFSYREYGKLKGMERSISALAGCIQGIYLIHPMVEELAALVTGYVMVPTTAIFLPLCAVVSFVLSFFVVLVLKKIPLIKFLV